MNIASLIEELKKKYPPAAEVIVTWEGTTHGLDPDSVYQSLGGAVLIDGDENFYKEEFVTGQRVSHG